MQVKSVTLDRSHIKCDSNNEYCKAVINNKLTPTSETILNNLSRVLLDLFFESKGNEADEAVDLDE